MAIKENSSATANPQEKPILFSAPMVRAILEGRKTQTRRIFKGMIPPECAGIHSCAVDDGIAKFHLNGQIAMHEGEWTKTPYGKPGDRLWVRETWAQVGTQGTLSGYVRYKADEQKAVGAYGSQKWRPSIFMPRSASRITLEITGVRVERLQEITEADAIAEGVFPCDAPACVDEHHPGRHQCAFEDLWDVINGELASWTSNPWVWVVSFKRLEGK